MREERSRGVRSNGAFHEVSQDNAARRARRRPLRAGAGGRCGRLGKAARRRLDLFRRFRGRSLFRLTLGTEGAIGGASIDISATCLRNFPFGDVAAWTLRDDGIAFIDPLRKTVIVLSKSEDGSYGATLDDGRQVSLDRGAPQEPQSLKELLDGTFTLSGANDAEACGFAVSARSSNGGTLEQAGACPDRWKGKGWAKWRFAAGKLDLLTKKDKVILTMVPADGFTFTAEEDAGPIYFGPGAIQGE